MKKLLNTHFLEKQKAVCRSESGTLILVEEGFAKNPLDSGELFHPDFFGKVTELAVEFVTGE